MSDDGPSWEPRSETRDDTVTATAAAALHGLLDAPGPPPRAGEPLPPLWHWLAFLPAAPQRQLGLDGHPRHGTFLPPSRLPRRMFAGGRTELAARVEVGQPIHRRSIVTSVTEKSGRSGELLFVEVTHELSCDSRPAISETQDLVYRGPDPGGRGPAAAPGSSRDAVEVAAEGQWPWQLELATDPALLFRFSALTYNAHRIHYDRDYATGVEGYPGLVVQGPLQAVALAELCRRNAGDRRVATFTFRALRPAFDGAPLQLRGRLHDGDRVQLVALDRDGHATMRADVVLHPQGS